MGQTSYSIDFSEAPMRGQMAGGLHANVVESRVNAEGADIPAGVMVAKLSDGTVDLIDGITDKGGGIVLNSFARDPNDLENSDAVKDGAVCNVLVRGYVWVPVEEAVDEDDDVHVRCVAGVGEELGAFRKSADSSDTRKVFGARWCSSTSGAGVALLAYDIAADLAGLQADD